ncbi:MAG TPA: LuxR C-terminal-related transcriptional regulator [Terriglobales bacterium]|nr:LuxR C-terminal-related transcriptional regulator [Terriglobales bacterium]
MANVKKVFSKMANGEQQRGEPLTTDHEKKIVKLVAQGCPNSVIAKRLSVDERTVSEDLHRIFDKLGVSNRFELALYAVYRRLVNSSEA